MKDPSRIYRVTLLLASLLTIFYLLAAAIRENYLAEWQSVQRQYRSYLEAKATDDRGRQLLREYRVELKQVAIPALGAVDRCVSCHPGIDDPRMKGLPNPYGTHPGDILKHHPVDRYGCTVCHQGQGQATNFHDAKAEDAFWDYPLLGAEQTQSSCLACHDAEKLPAGQVALLREGIRLYQAKSCGSCHKLEGRGGMLGTALDDEGSKTKHQLIMANLKPPHTTARWHEQHFRDPGAVVAGSQMKNQNLTPREIRALTVYMLALRRRDVPESYLAPDKIEEKYRALHRPALSGEEAYKQYCYACHADGSYGRWEKTFKRFIPAIRGAGLLSIASAEYLTTNIAKGRPGTQMPNWEGLQKEEISALVQYLRGPSPSPNPQPPTPAAPGSAGTGAALFGANCAGCHGATGRGGIAPELNNPTFQQAASDTFIAATIRNGRKGTAMPAFQRPGTTGLNDKEIGDVIAFLRTFAPAASAAGGTQ